MGEKHDNREHLETWIADLERAGADAVDANLSSTLRADLDRSLADPKVSIVVCGEWSSGKSSLVNALVGLPGLLPVDVNPTTSYLTVVEAGVPEVFTCTRAGTEVVISRQEFQSLTAEREYDVQIERLRATVPVAWPDGLSTLVDTPGLENLDKQHSAITLDYLPKADAIVVVVAAGRGVSDAVVTFVKEHLTRREQSRVVFVLNQKDHLETDSDLQRRLQHCRSTLGGILPGAPWIATNAKVTERDSTSSAWSESGVPSLRMALSTLVRQERSAMLADRFVGIARRRLAESADRASAEEATLRLTVAEAERRVSDFKKQVREASVKNDKAFAQARRQVTAEVRTWVSSIPSQVDEFAAQVRGELSSLGDLEALRTYVNSDGLGRRLARDIRELSREINDKLSIALQAAARDALQGQLVAPVMVEVDASLPFPEVDTVFKHVPGWIVNVLEIVLLDFATPGGGIAGVLVGVLERWGLDKLLRGVRGLGFLKQFMPSEFARKQLCEAAEETLQAYSAQVVQHVQQQTAEAADAALQAIRDALEGRVAAVEAGLEEARVLLSSRQAEVDARRTQLSGARAALVRAQSELDAFVGEFKRAATAA